MKTIQRLLILTTAALLCGTLAAMETGEIRGKVQDEKGLKLPGVMIRATGPSLQGSRTVISLKDGEFRFSLLPVGTYTLTFKLDGFGTVVQEKVIVRLGQITSLAVTMKISSLKEEVVVTAETPLIDKTSTDTSFHLTSADLEKLPAQNRTVVDAVKNAPGVVGVRVNTRRGTATEGQPSFRGEGEEGNTWIVDGLAVSGVRLRNSGVRLNFDAVDEIQVISDPFSPEYGSAYGGIINMVTKSGGNEFKGDLSLIFADKNLQAERREQLSVVSEPAYFSNQNWYANLGGPIVKNKLWFFLSNNYFRDVQETRDSVFGYLQVPKGRKAVDVNHLFSKLTWSPHANHTLSLTSMFNTSLGQTGGIGLPELYDQEMYTDVALRINDKIILNPTTFVEAGLGLVKRNDVTEPVDKDSGPAMYFVEDLGQNIHNSYGRVTDNQKRFDASFKLTKFADTETFGRHEMALGFEYYDVSSEFKVDFTGKSEDLFPGNGFDGGTKYYFDTWKPGQATPTFFYEYGPFNMINSSRGIGIFARDKVSWGRINLMAGIRSQTQLCLDNKGKALWSWGLGDFFSPRITLAYDLSGDSRNILKLGWGRFSDLITTMPLGLLNSGAGLSFRTYGWQGKPTPDATDIHNPANWTFKNEQKLQAFEVADGIKPDFLTRLLIEFDHRLARDWAVKARYIRTNAENLLEVLAVYDPNTLYKFLYDNFEYKRRDYSGIEVEITGKIGYRLFLNASYSHALARGTNPGQTETGSWSQEEGSTNYLGLFGNHLYVPDRPELKDVKTWVDYELGGLGGRGIGDEGWYGKLPYSIDHDLKISAIYLAPLGFGVSATFEWISGYYWEKLGYVPFFGGYYSFPEGRGSRMTPANSYLDLTLDKKFRLPAVAFMRAPSLSLRIDVFNVFNGQQPISYVKENTLLFGTVWGRQQPRQVRAAAKISW